MLQTWVWEPHRRSLHNHFRLRSSSWSRSACADPLSLEDKGICRFGGDFFLSHSESFHQGNRSGFSWSITKHLVSVLPCSMEFHRSATSRVTGNVRKDRPCPQAVVHSFSPCPTAWPLRDKILWEKKCHHLPSPPWTNGQTLPSPKHIPWLSPRNLTWKHPSGCTCKMPSDVCE